MQNSEICVQQKVVKVGHWDFHFIPDLQITKSNISNYLFSYSTER